MKRRRGFTLIELTIVLALIALLLTLAVPRYFHVIDNGKRTVQRENLTALRDAIDKFYGDLGRYPDELDDLVKKRYLRAIPVDPATEKTDWNVIAPEDPTLGRVFDVASASETKDTRITAAKDSAAADAKSGTPRQSPSTTPKAGDAR